MAVFVLFYGWLEFSKSCAFGAGLAALANQQEQNQKTVRLLANTDNKSHLGETSTMAAG